MRSVPYTPAVYPAILAPRCCGARFACPPIHAHNGGACLPVLIMQWQVEHAQQLSNFLDPATRSCIIVTTRIQGLVAGAAEVQLGVLPAEEACRMMLAVAGADAAPPV